MHTRGFLKYVSEDERRSQPHVGSALYDKKLELANTNAEWYDMVCSNVFSKIEQSNNLNNQPMLLPNGESIYFKSGINTNAYHFVDVIAERGPAPIYFNSWHPGRLGSPIVVALR